MPRIIYVNGVKDHGQSNGQTKREDHGQSKVIYPQGRSSSSWDHGTAMEYMDQALRPTRSRARVTRPRQTDRLMSKTGRSRFETQAHTAVGRVLTRALNDMTKAGIITTAPSSDDIVDLILSWVPTWLDYVGEPDEARGASLLPYRWLEATAREHSAWIEAGGWERQWVLDRVAMGRRGGKNGTRGAKFTVDVVDALQPATYRDVMDGLGCKETTAKTLLKQWRDSLPVPEVEDEDSTVSFTEPNEFDALLDFSMHGQSKRAEVQTKRPDTEVNEPHFNLLEVEQVDWEELFRMVP
jgi:hypothetical protein